MSEEQETFDFIIVGSGGGSMCAALVVHAMGLKALILEKTDLIGGTTAKSGGVMWIPNNRFMKRDGVEDSVEQAMRYLDHIVGDHDDTPGASRARRLTYVTEASRMVEFLLEQGIKLDRHPHWPDYHDDAPGASIPGRTVFAELFDSNELGEARTGLRPNMTPLPLKTDEMWKIPLFKTTWAGKVTLARLALRLGVARITGRRWVGSGAALQGRMYQQAIRAGVDIRSQAAVQELLTDTNGNVTGVAATLAGKTRRFIARSGVLINAGGFAHNQAMRDRYQPGTSSKWTAACSGDTGEMIQEMIRVGAGIAQMNEMVGNQVAMTPGDPEQQAMVVSELAKPHSIVVDQSGIRYLREAQSYMSFCQQMFARDKISPAIPSWMVMDSQYLAKYMVAGTMPGSAKPPDWFASGFMKKADTLEKLATACGMDAGNLTGSVTRLNESARKGEDAELLRGAGPYSRFLGDSGHHPSPSLGTIEKGPFYAYQFYPGDVGTYGGVVTDAHARVLRADGSVIQGLYATGTSTASVMGRVYPGAGCSVGPSFVWGYVAARHATAT
jgi:3-oxosteroid 1-dehydrogenase